MTGHDTQPTSDQDSAKHDVGRRVDAIGWALFFIMLGVLWLMPDERIPEEAWLVGAGVILLGVNGARYLCGVKASVFTIVLGFVALGYGLSSIYETELPLFPILVILVGLVILIKAFRRKPRV